MKSKPLAERSHSARLWLFKAMALMMGTSSCASNGASLDGTLPIFSVNPTMASTRLWLLVSRNKTGNAASAG